VCGALRAPHTAGKRPAACGGGLREAPRKARLREAAMAPGGASPAGSAAGPTGPAS